MAAHLPKDRLSIEFSREGRTARSPPVGTGLVRVGKTVLKPQRSDVDGKDVTLLEWESVLVVDMTFNLVAKNQTCGKLSLIILSPFQTPALIPT